MENHDFSSLTLTAIQAALKAGDILKKGFGTSYKVSAKPGRQNLVTEYDHASEDCIISFIKEEFPSHRFLAEESGLFGSFEQETILWIIDPLDGTTNFARHLPLFTISIAAVHKGQILSGVIFQPLTHELFVAEKGKGAYLNGTRLKVSEVATVDQSILVTSFPYELTYSPTLDINKLLQANIHGVTLRNFGSAALSLAYIAAGKIEALWMYNLYPWDSAAGQLLIEEAGGKMSYYKNIELDEYGPSHILATNQALHTHFQEYLLFSH
jgi:myo-inositol-1(or 4)-monophosphatase